MISFRLAVEIHSTIHRSIENLYFLELILLFHTWFEVIAYHIKQIHHICISPLIFLEIGI